MTSVDLGHLIIFLELLLSFYIPTLLSWASIAIVLARDTISSYLICTIQY